jgi:hypothetical protein
MKTKNENLLPQTTEEIKNGGVYLQRRRCGKSNCHCAGGELHIGHYFIRRINGKFIKTYIRNSEVEQITEIVNKAAADRREKRRSNQELLERIKEINARGREMTAFLNSLKGR